MNAPDPRMRIADSDRERAMADLAMHYADGRLEHEEYDERLDAIWTARTRADLARALQRPAPPAGRAAAAHDRAFTRQAWFAAQVPAAAGAGLPDRAQRDR